MKTNGSVRKTLWVVGFALTASVVGLSRAFIRNAPFRTPLSARCCVLITLDTCRADALGCYGSERAKTPNLDALAERGCLFERCLTPIPITLPAHCSLFTGTYPPEHGVRVNGKILDENIVTLAEILSEAGVATAAFVGSYACSSDFGLSQGFHVYDDPFAEAQKGRGVVGERTCLDVNTAARKWILAQAEKPFFLWVHYFDPHAPHEAPLPYSAWFPDRPYDAEVAFVDRAIGQLLDAVVREVGEDGLLVVVVGDHGEGLDDHDEKEHGHLLYDSTVRVPLITAGGPVPRGKRVSAQTCLVDLASTIQKWLLDEVAGSNQGVLSSRAAFPWVKEGEIDQRFVYGETLWPYEKYGWSPGRRVSSQDWVLILDPGPRLFHVPSDSGQTRDLSSEHPEKVQELRQAMEKAEGRWSSDFRASSSGSADGLRQLGYLGMDRLGEGQPIPWAEELPSPTDMIGLVRFERRGLAYKAVGRKEDARREFESGLSQDPNNLQLMNELGRLSMEAGKHEEALRLFVRLDEVERGSCMGLINQGVCHEALKNWRAAETVYERAVSKDASSWQAWFNLARLRLSRGDLRGSRNAWETAAAIAPQDSPTVRDLGKQIEKMEDL